jgi:hypothetical protein
MGWFTSGYSASSRVAGVFFPVGLVPAKSGIAPRDASPARVHLLTRDEVRQFHRLLLAAQAALNRLSPPSEKHEGTYEAAEATLSVKARLVRRALALPWPGLLYLAASTIMLSRDELAVLEVDTVFLVQDIELDEATYCYAVVSSSEEQCVRHLIHKSRRERRGPVLCGCTPCGSLPAPSRRGWFFGPFAGRPAEDGEEPLCPRCLEHWQAQQKGR